MSPFFSILVFLFKFQKGLNINFRVSVMFLNVYCIARKYNLNDFCLCFKGVPATPRVNQSSNIGGMASIPSIQLLGLEMMLHFLLGPEVLCFAKQHKLVLSLGIYFGNNFMCLKQSKTYCGGWRRGLFHTT